MSTDTDALVPVVFLGDGKTAFPSSVVAQWPAHNRERFNMRLYGPDTIERLTRERDETVARERERIAKECNDTADAYRRLFRKEALAGDPAVVADRFAAYAIALDDMARAIRATT